MWRGDIPLARAFWEYVVLYGFLTSAVATLGSLALVSMGQTIAGIVVHAMPIPYQVFASVAAWRSADRYHGPDHWAFAAKGGIVAFGLAATIL